MLDRYRLYFQVSSTDGGCRYQPPILKKFYSWHYTGSLNRGMIICVRKERCLFQNLGALFQMKFDISKVLKVSVLGVGEYSKTELSSWYRPGKKAVSSRPGYECVIAITKTNIGCD